MWKQIKWNPGGGKVSFNKPLICCWMVFQIIFKIHHVLLTPPCAVAGIKPSERVTMATAMIFIYLHMRVPGVHTHTTLNWLRRSMRCSLLSSSQEQVRVSNWRGWDGSSKFYMMEAFKREAQKPMNICSVCTSTHSLHNTLPATKRKPNVYADSAPLPK